MPFLPFLKDENNFRLVVSGGKRGEGAKWHPSRLVFAVRKKRKTTLVFGRCLFMTKCGIHFSVSHKNSGAGIGGTCYTWAFFSADRKIILSSSIWENVVLLFRGLEGSFLREVILVVKGGGVERYIAFVAKTFITKSRPFKNMQEMF